MPRNIIIKKTDNCPCLSGKKYKHCCEGTVDWNWIIKEGEDYRNFLSIRGRNLLFFERISEALHLDRKSGLADYKKAFTARAVQKIHESIMEIWPPNMDIELTLRALRKDVSALYIGDFKTKYIERSLVHHSIYTNKIIIVDPFIYPISVRDEFNPALNPEPYRAQTLENVNFWYALQPWIEAGIVEIVRTPSDFHTKLGKSSLRIQQKKFQGNVELRKAAEKSVEELHAKHVEDKRIKNLIQSAPISFLEQVYKILELDSYDITFENLTANIDKFRTDDPEFLENIRPGKESGEIQMFSSNANYEIAQLIATITNSYMLTDIYSKWQEIEIDRKSHNATNIEWAPVVKAFQNVRLKRLNNLGLNHALLLRKEDRLSSLRNFFTKLWEHSCSDDISGEISAKTLADELRHEVREAEEEWKQIGIDMWKWFGREVVSGKFASGEFIATSRAEYFPVAVGATATGMSALLAAMGHKEVIHENFPAAFFMGDKI